MTLSAAFGQLRTNVELTGLQRSTVATRQQNVRAALDKSLAVRDDFLTGSYVRSTLIGPLSRADVDIVVVLDDVYRARGPKGVLQLVRKVLLDTYPSTPKISSNGQAVTITFSDFTVDVVPAFAGGWWLSGYEICDSGSNTWIRTNPKKHVEISSAANSAHGGLLVPCVKQLKAWNRTVNRPLRSFHIEVLAWEIFGTQPWPFQATKMGRDWENVRYFFDKARDRLPRQQRDPAGTGTDVGAYLGGGQALNDAVSKAKSAYERCGRAENAAAAGNLAAAHAAYRQVFGDYYPPASVA